MIHKQANGNKVKVFVGLSGGVDSAVSAAILKRDGYDITGVFIKVWQPEWIECTWKEERRSAMRVAAHLNIPFETLDLAEEYKRDVADYMINEYAIGRTPNPDVMCNRYIKFGGFWKWAKERGADFIATGHYTRVLKAKSRSETSRRDLVKTEARPLNILLAGKDQNKDQSYFLWTLNQDDLDHVMFPVGDIEKPEVRKLAKKFKLPNAEKKDSQGICFIGKVDMKEFLAHYIKTKAGDVLNEKNEIIGTHPGALYFTNGERHGFTLTDKTPNDAPFYVVKKDMEKNTITVSNRLNNENTEKTNKIVTIKNVNWVAFRGDDSRIFKLGLEAVPGGKAFGSEAGPRDEAPKFQARTRYRQPLQDIKVISSDKNGAVIEFEKTQEAISPGQSLVIYDQEICLGGGIIF